MLKNMGKRGTWPNGTTQCQLSTCSSASLDLNRRKPDNTLTHSADLKNSNHICTDSQT